MLDAENFLGVVSAAPLVAVDLVLVRGGCEMLLGLRYNRPAQGFWFVPGGRILKNEPIQAALARVAANELGLQLAALPHAPTLMGAFEHFYPDSFAGSAESVGVSTHYVVLGHLVRVPANFALPGFDAQHAELRWWPLAEAQASPAVHRFTKDYVDSFCYQNRSCLRSVDGSYGPFCLKINLCSGENFHENYRHRHRLRGLGQWHMPGRGRQRCVVPGCGPGQDQAA